MKSAGGLLGKFLVLGALALATGPAQAAGRVDDAITFQWPEAPMQREVIGYVASSLVPIRPLPHRPTLAQRLEHAPFLTGENRVALDLSTLDPAAAAAFRAIASGAGAGAQLNFGSFSPLADKLYGPRRAPGGNLAGLLAFAGRGTDPNWAHVDVRSVLTHTERRIWYHTRKVLETTVTAMENGRELAFPLGSCFFAEHFDAAGKLHETHALVKRADQEWDYLLYDKEGTVQSSSQELPNLRAPTTCFACHRNAARLTPFREFPDAAETVNGFKPEVMVALSVADKEIARKFVRTGPRDDHMHGVYGGIAALSIRDAIHAGTAPAWAKALWPRLVKLVPGLAAAPGL